MQLLFKRKQRKHFDMDKAYVTAADLEYHERIKSAEDNLVQIIVRCDESEEIKRKLESLGRIKYNLPMINSYVVEMRQKNVDEIMNSVGALEIEFDAHITAQMNQAREEIEVSYAHDRGIYGEGVTVAVLDTGVSLHPDLTENGNRVIAFQDFINERESPYDDNGHGTHVSGIIGGDGLNSEQTYLGVAPRCNIAGVKVLNHRGNGNISDVLAGLQWILDNKDKYNIRVVNISVGTTSKNEVDEKSLLVKGVDAIWDAGIVVVVAAGNNGPKPMSISIPGISRKVITVGASDDNISVELSGNKTKDYSGRGPTSSCIKKPDIVAPGSNIISCNATKNFSRKSGSMFNLRNDLYNNRYTTKSGTSMATPIVSGAIALLLSAKPYLTNKDVKMLLRNAGTDLGYPQSKQGWGLLNVRKLLTQDVRYY